MAAKERRDNDNHMIAAMFGGHATFTLSDETMDKMAEANNGLTGFHIHVCEGMNDVWDSRLNRGGISPSSACCSTTCWVPTPCWATAST